MGPTSKAPTSKGKGGDDTGGEGKGGKGKGGEGSVCLVLKLPLATPLGSITTTFKSHHADSDSLLRRLQSIQNAAARLITGTRRRHHITPVLRELQDHVATGSAPCRLQASLASL